MSRMVCTWWSRNGVFVPGGVGWGTVELGVCTCGVGLCGPVE